jgi:integrase
VTREQALLRAIFEAAIEDDLMVKNPLKGVPKLSEAPRTRVLTSEEQAKLIQDMPPKFGRWLNFMLGTGVRLAESLAIKVGDIDLIHKTIRIIGKGHNGMPKIRFIPIIGDELLSLIKIQLEENSSDVLWPYHPRSLQMSLKRACVRLKIPHLSPHALRHTFATRYLIGGGDIFILAKILGHASVNITESVYAHLKVQDHAKLSEHVDLGLTPIDNYVERQQYG